MENQGEGAFALLMVALYVAAIIVPVAKVLRRVGFSGWWSILALVPLVNFVALWFFAFMKWPRD